MCCHYAAVEKYQVIQPTFIQGHQRKAKENGFAVSEFWQNSKASALFTLTQTKIHFHWFDSSKATAVSPPKGIQQHIKSNDFNWLYDVQRLIITDCVHHDLPNNRAIISLKNSNTEWQKIFLSSPYGNILFHSVKNGKASLTKKKSKKVTNLGTYFVLGRNLTKDEAAFPKYRQYSFFSIKITVTFSGFVAGHFTTIEFEHFHLRNI